MGKNERVEFVKENKEIVLAKTYYTRRQSCINTIYDCKIKQTIKRYLDMKGVN